MINCLLNPTIDCHKVSKSKTLAKCSKSDLNQIENKDN